MNDKDEEIIAVINGNYSEFLDRENAVIETVTRQEGFYLSPMVVLGRLCEIIVKLDQQRRIK